MPLFMLYTMVKVLSSNLKFSKELISLKKLFIKKKKKLNIFLFSAFLTNLAQKYRILLHNRKMKQEPKIRIKTQRGNQLTLIGTRTTYRVLVIVWIGNFGPLT